MSEEPKPFQVIKPKDNIPSEVPDFDRPKSDAQICIYNFLLKEEKIGKYTVYSIKGSDKDGEFETQRRYSEFDKIRAVLVNRWPGVYIPPLPPKQNLAKLESKFLEMRRKALEEFARLISEAPHLHYSEEWQVFLRSKGDLDKALQAFQKIDYEDLLAKYTKAFSYLSDKAITNQIILKITGTKLFLTKMSKNFEKIRKVSRSFVLSKKNFYGQLANLHHLAYVPYEKNIFSEYHAKQEGKNVFSNSDDAQVAAAEKLKDAATRDSVEHIYDYLEQDAREIEAFLEALSQKEKYDQLKNKTQDKQRSESDGLQKVLAGKKTLKTIFSTKPKEDKVNDIEKTIATHAKNYEALTALHDIITIILAYDEIDRFTKNKVDRYYKMLYLSSGNELLNLHAMEDYWVSILANPNILPLVEE